MNSPNHKSILPKQSARFFLIILFICFLSVLAVTPVYAVEEGPAVGSIRLNVPVPGLERDFSGNVTDYIKAIYRFFVGIAGILAVFMIVFGGVQWLFSGGNATKISSAKETIFGAVLGLLIAVGSYTILININPRLVNLGEFKVPGVQTGRPEWYNEDGSCKESGYIPCGYKCVPKAGAPGPSVMGFCEWCRVVGMPMPPCGSNNAKDEFKNYKINGNCWFAKCLGGACTYLSSDPNNLVASKFGPQCSQVIPASFKGEEYSFYVHEKFYDDIPMDCGKIYIGYERNLAKWTGGSIWYTLSGGHVTRYLAYPINTFNLIGSTCPSNKYCTIDLSNISWDNAEEGPGQLSYFQAAFAVFKERHVDEIGSFPGSGCK